MFDVRFAEVDAGVELPGQLEHARGKVDSDRLNAAVSGRARLRRLDHTQRQAAAQPARHHSVEENIEVLPFLNLSSDPAQEHFADGIVEDLISGLSGSSLSQVANLRLILPAIK